MDPVSHSPAPEVPAADSPVVAQEAPAAVEAPASDATAKGPELTAHTEAPASPDVNPLDLAKLGGEPDHGYRARRSRYPRWRHGVEVLQ